MDKYSEYNNLDDEILNVAEEQGYAKMEVARMTRSRNPEDRAIVQKWINIATSRVR